MFLRFYNSENNRLIFVFFISFVKCDGVMLSGDAKAGACEYISSIYQSLFTNTLVDQAYTKIHKMQKTEFE